MCILNVVGCEIILFFSFVEKGKGTSPLSSKKKKKDILKKKREYENTFSGPLISSVFSKISGNRE